MSPGNALSNRSSLDQLSVQPSVPFRASGSLGFSSSNPSQAFLGSINVVDLFKSQSATCKVSRYSPDPVTALLCKHWDSLHPLCYLRS